MRIAVLGPGGVGGLLAGLLARAGGDVVVIAQESTAEVVAARGVDVSSVTFGRFVARPRAVTRLEEPADALLVATKAGGLDGALGRIAVTPGVVLPLLNGLDHIAVLRRRFAPESVLAGTIRVEADRPEPGVVIHTSPFLLVSMATAYATAEGHVRDLAAALDAAGVSVKVQEPIGSAAAEAQVMWSKLVRLNALACTTSAYDVLLGEIRSTPALRADLVGAIEEACAVARAEGARIAPADAIGELERAHATLGSSMQRDIAAGREPELDAIPGSVLRAAARHGLGAPTIEKLTALIARRAGVADPALVR
jgi:2-dehydropantoate 2-reductase